MKEKHRKKRKVSEETFLREIVKQMFSTFVQTTTHDIGAEVHGQIFQKPVR